MGIGSTLGFWGVQILENPPTNIGDIMGTGITSILGIFGVSSPMNPKLQGRIRMKANPLKISTVLAPLLAPLCFLAKIHFLFAFYLVIWRPKNIFWIEAAANSGAGTVLWIFKRNHDGKKPVTLLLCTYILFLKGIENFYSQNFWFFVIISRKFLIFSVPERGQE